MAGETFGPLPEDWCIQPESFEAVIDVYFEVIRGEGSFSIGVKCEEGDELYLKENVSVSGTGNKNHTWSVKIAGPRPTDIIVKILSGSFSTTHWVYIDKAQVVGDVYGQTWSAGQTIEYDLSNRSNNLEHGVFKIRQMF
jgi:hypothetical protein